MFTPKNHAAAHVEDYRARPGEIALTIDMAGLTPTTVTIPATKLAGLLSRFDQVMAGKIYAETARIFSAGFRHWKSGHDEASNVGLLGFGLVFRHPAGGPPMAEAASEMIARGEPAHLSLNISAAGGVTIALGDRFVDLDRLAAGVEAAKMGVTVFDMRAPGPRR